MPVAEMQSPTTVRADTVREGVAMDELPERATVSVGAEAQLGLPSLAAAGYRWQATADDPAIVVASIRFEDASAAAGSSPAFAAHEVLVLTGRAPGSTTVRCSQRRSWEAGEPSAEHTVTVEVVAAADGQKSTKKE